MNTLTSPPDGATRQQLDGFRREGYLVVRGLIESQLVLELRRRFDVLATAGKPAPDGLWTPDLSPEGSKDSLRRYPRVMMPHRFDSLARQCLLHPAVGTILRELLGEEPIAAQSMFYFKPPGARGQALHQDNFYLSVKPGTCLAAWTAVDPANQVNGGLYVVPQTQAAEIICPETADVTESFTKEMVRVPRGCQAIPLSLQPGDTLFFNGNLIHGSAPNRSEAQWRRAFICHYIPRSAQYVSKWYFPLIDFQGRQVTFTPNAEGGPCGAEFEAPVYGK
ncbi:phytanoyl-CoA dioxygenase family protein [bacterium]|nr:phytanoyl-CoA dioxygenase family protein [bacterium]